MNLTFETFELATPLKESLSRLNFTIPTPIQNETLSATLNGKNLIGCAQTGSGKTVAYCLPLVQSLLDSPDETALILVPTRELVKQVGEVLQGILKNIPKIRTVELIGGQAIQHQIRELKKKPFPRIIIATPGRLIDLINRNAVYLKNIGFLVLDEADRMLDMGFAPQLQKIDRKLPSKELRQTLMFSATMPDSVNQLVGQFLQDEVRVTIGKATGETHHIDQSVISVTHENKRDRLLDELNNHPSSVIIFVGSKHRTDRLAQYLAKYGHAISLIHGDRSQSQRNKAIQNFRSGKSRILVATDIVARGLDVPQVGVVINYDLPRASEDYAHRIGRSGRAGSKGEALTFVMNNEKGQWKRIVKACRLDPSLNKIDTSKWVKPKFESPVEHETKTLNPETKSEMITLENLEERFPAKKERWRDRGDSRKKKTFSRSKRQRNNQDEGDERIEKRDRVEKKRPRKEKRGEKRDRLESSDRPEKTGRAEKGGRWGKKVFSDKRGRFEKKDRFGKRDRFEKGDRFEKRDGFEKKGKFARSGRFEKNDRFEKTDRFEKNDRSDKRDFGERKERFEKRDRPEKKNRWNKKDRFDKKDRFEKRTRFDKEDRPEKDFRFEKKPRFDKKDRPEKDGRFERRDRAENRERNFDGERVGSNKKKRFGRKFEPGKKKTNSSRNQKRPRKFGGDQTRSEKRDRRKAS